MCTKSHGAKRRRQYETGRKVSKYSLEFIVNISLFMINLLLFQYNVTAVVFTVEMAVRRSDQSVSAVLKANINQSTPIIVNLIIFSDPNSKTLGICASVSKYIMYSWALCTDLHSYLLALSTTNPNGWGAQLFFYLFSLLPPQRGYHIAP